MRSYFAKALEIPFDAAVDKVVSQLETKWFSVLTTRGQARIVIKHGGWVCSKNRARQYGKK